MKTVAITGANGFLGTELVKYFSNKGWAVKALAREAPTAKNKNVSFVAYDIAKPLPKDALKGVDYILHAAYIKFDRKHPEAMDVNVAGAKRLVTAARAAGVKKMVFMSSMSAHEGAESVYGKQKLAIEKLFSGPDAATIRSGLIIGNGGIVKQMVEFMKSKHVVPLIGGGKQPLQVIGVHDLVRVIEKLLTTNNSGVYTIATPEVYTYKQFYQAIAKDINVKVLFVPVPFFVLMTALKVVSLLPLPIAVSPDNALGLKHLIAVDTAKDLKTLGITLDPLDVALAKQHLQ